VRFAWREYRAHPLLGIGPGGLGIKLQLPPRTSGSHSTYLTAAAELGTFGILALFLVIAVALGLLGRSYRLLRAGPFAALSIGLGSAYVGFLASNVTYDIFFDDFHWVILGAVTALAAEAVTMSRQSEPKADRDNDAIRDSVADRAPTLATRFWRAPRDA
jgi:O-antigen ligase